MGRAARGRADLLRCLHAEGGEALTAMAGLAGYRRVPPARSMLGPAARSEPQGSGPDAADAATHTPPAVLPEPDVTAVGRFAFYRVVGYQAIEHDLPIDKRPDWYHDAQPFSPEELARQPRAAPVPEPLVPWPRLWPFLRAALGEWTERHEPDLARLVELLAHGQAPRRLPRRRLHRWAPACQLLLDLAPRLTQFHDDAWKLLPALQHLRGHLGLDVYVLTDGPDRDFRRPGAPAPVPYKPPARRQPLLILSDLGCLGEPTDRTAWRRFGRLLAGVGAKPVALTPCPPRFWDPRLLGLYFPVTWDRAHRLPPGPGGPRPWPGTRVEPADDPGAARLLDLLAPAVRLEPALLRGLRHSLPGPVLDVGAEAAVWVHPDLDPTPCALTWTDQHAVERRRAAYRAQPESDRYLAGALIRRYHAHLPGSVRAEEDGNVAQLGGGVSDPELVDYLARTLRTFEQADPGRHAALAAWAARLGTRQHADAWRADPPRAAIWIFAHRDELRNGSRPLPPGLALSAADWVLAADSEPKRYSLVQRERSLVAEVTHPRPSATGDSFPGSPMADLWLSEAPVFYRAMDDPDHFFSVALTRGDAILLTGTGIVLVGPTEVLFIESMSRPIWASDIGRDDYGLWAEFALQGVIQRMRWISPGEFTMGSPSDEHMRFDDELQHQVILTRGFWIADTACSQALWETMAYTNPSQFKGAERPVEQVSWYDVQEFIRSVNAHVPDLKLRLPTEAEWEYACRAGTGTPFWFGEDISHDKVNYLSNHPYRSETKGIYRRETVDVKALPCNAWGLYQMHGNVWEWCMDSYADYPDGIVADPCSSSGWECVVRGGGWVDNARFCRSAQRIRWAPSACNVNLGFRLARDP